MKEASCKKRCFIKVLFVSCMALFVLSGCQSHRVKPGGKLVEDDHDLDNAIELFQELGGDDIFFDLVKYLYRWHLDEDDFENRELDYRGKLWLRKLERELDQGDKSQFMELAFPAMGIEVVLKKTDYYIDEMQLEVKSKGYKICEVRRSTWAMLTNELGYVSLDMDADKLHRRLFETRCESQYPDEELFKYLRKCVAEQCEDFSEGLSGEQEIWLAPISGLANEIWIYWEERKMLFRFVSDVDMHNKEVWEHDAAIVTPYDIIDQTVVSHEEAPGADGFITRDQVGRVLFNCMVFGRKVRINL